MLCLVWSHVPFDSSLFIVRLVKYINSPVERKSHILTLHFFCLKSGEFSNTFMFLKVDQCSFENDNKEQGLTVHICNPVAQGSLTQ